jgi:hypothetical protein
MTKSELETFVSVLNDAGVTEYSIRYEGGNRVTPNNGRSGVLKFAEDSVYAFEVDDNSYGKQGPFIVRKIGFEDISTIQARGLTVEEAMNIVSALGIEDDAIVDIISKHGDNIKNVPSFAGYGVVKDKNGKDVLDGMAGRITTGANH